MRRRKRMKPAVMVNDPADLGLRRFTPAPLRIRLKQAWRVLRGESVAIGNARSIQTGTAGTISSFKITGGTIR